MNALISFFASRSFHVNLIMAFIFLAGALSLMNLRRDLVPPFEWQMIEVRANLPGASSRELEKLVTFPIEDSLKGLQGLDRMTSTSDQSNIQITLFFRADFDEMDQSVQEIRSRINQLQLPEDLKNLSVDWVKMTDIFLSFYAIQGVDLENVEHRNWMNRFEQNITQVVGVARVGKNFPDLDLYIDIDKKKLSFYEISVNEVRNILRKNLVFAPIGRFESKNNFYSLEMDPINSDLDKIRDIPLKGNFAGNMVRLRDVAAVNLRIADKQEIVAWNSVPSASFWVRKDIYQDTISLKDKIDKIVADLQKQMPPELKIISIIDGPHFIKKQLNVLSANAFVGFFLVIFILFLFLNFRTAIMTALGLPLCYMGVFLMMDFFGLSIDLISIIGLILVLGILVDDAIIVSEKYNQLRKEGLLPLHAARKAAQDLILPVTGTILTTIVAFSPLILIKSEIGNMLFAVPLVVIAALILSWIESFFILPNHLQHFVPNKEKPKKYVDFFFNKVLTTYQSLLKLCLRFRYLSLLFLGGVFAASFWLATNKIQQNYNLNIQVERLRISSELKQASSYENTRKILRPLEEKIIELTKEDFVEGVYTRVGSQWRNGQVFSGPKYANIDIYFDRNHSYPSELKEKLEKRVRTILDDFDQEAFARMEMGYSQEGQDELKENILVVQVKGTEEVPYTQIEKEIEASLMLIKGIVEYVKNPNILEDIWVFEPDYQSLWQNQMTSSNLAQEIRGIFQSDYFGESRIMGQNRKVYLEIQGKKEFDFKDLEEIRLMNAQGIKVPLSNFGRWKRKKDLAKIEHKNAMRVLNFDFKYDSEKQSFFETQKQAKETVAKLQTKYPNYSIELVEANEEAAKNRAWAIKVAVLCVGSVLLIIALLLGSITQPFLVGLPIPFGIIGIIWALYLHGMPLGLLALIGLVGTIGVSVNASIVMVDQINRYAKAEGKMTRESIVAGASSRLRAILLTTLTTLVGVFPMAYSLGGEMGFTQPLAFSMGWGLSSATFLTLFILPALLMIRLDILNWFSRFGKKKNKSEVIAKKREALSLNL